MFSQESDDDFEELLLVLLDEENRIAVPPHLPRFILDVTTLDEETFFSKFRFTLPEVRRLLVVLSFPDTVSTHRGVSSSSLFCLCVLLHRLAYPTRWIDLQFFFGRDKSSLHALFYWAVDHIYNQFHHLLYFDHEAIVPLLPYFAERISTKGSPYDRCFGFIDGTIRSICRPSVDQQEFYNGHDRVHALKFQSVVSPDGIIRHFFGPVSGRHHDSYILAESALLDTLSQHCQQHDGTWFHLYGDAGYPLRGYLLTPFHVAALTADEQDLNVRMSKVRESVEWGFHLLVSNWAFLDFSKNNKILLSPLDRLYAIAALLTNMKTCLQRNQISYFFECIPPSLEEYLHR